VGNNSDLTGHISVSVDIAECPDGNPSPLAERTLLATADAALYAAKHGGRNAVRRDNRV
jgi:GGDEF domain-containing protein